MITKELIELLRTLPLDTKIEFYNFPDNYHFNFNTVSIEYDNKGKPKKVDLILD